MNRVGDASLVWMRLPEEGRLEYLCGLVHMPGADVRQDPAAMEEVLRHYGYGPYVIDVKRIPVTNAGTTEELAKVLDRLAKPAGSAAAPASGAGKNEKDHGQR